MERFPDIADYIGMDKYDHAKKIYQEELDKSWETGFDAGQEDAIYNSELLADKWIEDGLHDDAVESRAKVLSMDYLNDYLKQNDLLQGIHEAMCGGRDNSPYGWEYCANCNS